MTLASSSKTRDSVQGPGSMADGCSAPCSVEQVSAAEETRRRFYKKKIEAAGRRVLGVVLHRAIALLHYVQRDPDEFAGTEAGTRPGTLTRCSKWLSHSLQFWFVQGQ